MHFFLRVGLFLQLAENLKSQTYIYIHMYTQIYTHKNRLCAHISKCIQSILFKYTITQMYVSMCVSSEEHLGSF